MSSPLLVQPQFPTDRFVFGPADDQVVIPKEGVELDDDQVTAALDAAKDSKVDLLITVDDTPEGDPA